MKKPWTAVLPFLLLAPAALLLLPVGCATTSPANPTATNTAQPGTAIVAGRVVRSGTPLSGASVALWQAGGSQQGTQTTDSSGNYSFTGVPLNPSGSNQFYVKWLGATPVSPPGTVDFSEFGLVQTLNFTVDQNATYSVGNFETGVAGLFLQSPADNSTLALSGNPNFIWTATTQTNLGYCYRLDNGLVIAPGGSGSTIYQYPASGYSPSMTNKTVGPGDVSASSTEQRYWRVAISQGVTGGIEVVASTKYWRVKLT